MKKIFLTVVIVGIFLATVVVVINFNNQPREKTDENIELMTTDYKNTTYTMVDGTVVTLVNGVAEKPLEVDSATSIVTRYFGNELFKDLNDDGRDDVVFLLTEERGGTGTYFYVVASLNTENGYVGSEALLLGDRIAPQTIESGPGKQIIVNYAERAIGEPMTTPPSVGKSLRLILDIASMQFGEVAPDFEGEANPNQLTLGMKTWVWQKADYNDGRTITPKRPEAFTLTFSNDGSVAVGTDCNNVGGEYTRDDNHVTITNMRTTLMYCEDSQETEFMKLLQDITSFHFTGRGELIFELRYDSGTVTFR